LGIGVLANGAMGKAQCAVLVFLVMAMSGGGGGGWQWVVVVGNGW
jgi:hypothetical protein